MYLDPKLCKHLVAQIKSGVPPVCAGLMYGINKKEVEKWVAFGREKWVDEHDPFPEARVTLDDGTTVSAQEFNARRRKHHKECVLLAKATMETDGKIVGALFKRIVKSSMRSQDMQKFLFKHFTHIHGMREQSPNKPIELIEDEVLDPVTIELPDNGRMISIPVGPNA